MTQLHSFESEKNESLKCHLTEKGEKDLKLENRSFSSAPNAPHEKINQCLTDINRSLTNIFKI